MVIGTGLVARSFGAYAKDDRFLIFASGVSNSKSSTEADFQREARLLLQSMEANPGMMLIYFSTTSVDDPDLQQTAYVQHKLNMEDLVRSNAHRYAIFRLSNLAGRSDNPNTILNYFFQHIAQGIPFQLWQRSERNIIDVEDVYRIADHLLQHQMATNRTLNIANTASYPVTYIVDTIEEFCGKQGLYSLDDRGGPVSIDTHEIAAVCETLGIRFGEGYLEKILQKYF
ncbi:NAD-dependent epimerase/dehydratase family protein [Pseudobacter ginsenosidimutans]|uniref:NAD-dependent epimerase/dehydratase family protein n=1 Tax=Pseudobacter ginsenosidimutans TaxID=661488 RepID=A0A4Q7N209_9BACT|nr:NAD-dependent epimerase/dehydratase family protein [Pseudobacter ginsenosidimutans]QEC43866.1 NAD-dependent epimerase/dehydratase family protein [Pseudobacter ginsenosidimutans]RZS75292.1 NAD-dependent epimerase/dehydratase family protein [Pseudobacter ginsenosidimutans]